MGRTRAKPIPLEQRTRIVLSVLAGEMTIAEAARRTGVSRETVTKWRDRFVAGGRDALQDKLSGPASGSMEERRLRAEAEQLKLALAEATVQLRIWQKGAELVDQVPSKTSRR